MDIEQLEKLGRSLDRFFRLESWYIDFFVAADFIEISTKENIWPAQYEKLIDTMELVDMKLDPENSENLEVEVEDENGKLLGYKNCYYFVPRF